MLMPESSIVVSASELAAQINKEMCRRFDAEIAPTIVQLRNEGLSLQQIADELGRRGIKTRQGFDFWDKKQVSRILERAEAVTQPDADEQPAGEAADPSSSESDPMTANATAEPARLFVQAPIAPEPESKPPAALRPSLPWQPAKFPFPLRGAVALYRHPDRTLVLSFLPAEGAINDMTKQGAPRQQVMRKLEAADREAIRSAIQKELQPDEAAWAALCDFIAKLSHEIERLGFSHDEHMARVGRLRHEPGTALDVLAQAEAEAIRIDNELQAAEKRLADARNEATTLTVHREKVERLPKDVDRLSAHRDELQSKLRRLGLEQSNPVEITETKQALQRVEMDLKDTERQLARVEEEATGRDARKRRLVTEIVNCIVSGTSDHLRQEREKLLRSIGEKVGAELTHLEEIELCLSIGDRREQAQQLTAEVIAAVGL
jgi:hypothetical protein